MLYRALGHVKNGFYIDVGAWSPVDSSITKAFYDRGWRGINIEPVAVWYEQLVSDRPGDINLCVGISDEPLSAEIYEVANSGLSTFVPEYAEKHALAGHEIRRYSVPVVTLAEILEEHAVKEVHFLKIDAEGKEKQVLEGMDFRRVKPVIVVVEATEPNSTREVWRQWDPILTRNGYKFVYFDGLNRFYLNEQYLELERHFETPPNVFDEFRMHRELAAKNNAAIFEDELRCQIQLLSNERDMLAREVEALLKESPTLKHEQESAKALRTSLLQKCANKLKSAYESVRTSPASKTDARSR